MYSNSRGVSLPSSSINTNAIQGSYRPFFFDLAEFNLSRVDFSTSFFEYGRAEIDLLKGGFSFCYLREDKIRMIDAYENDGTKIMFNQFVERLGITIKSKNLFKTGKYLSRVFRPVRYGKFFRGLDVHVNNNPAYAGKVTDGISLISLELAKHLSWKNTAVNKSAQFTLFFSRGLVKGHCVVSDKIEHDIVIYGTENIKGEISLGNDLQYIALEPVKLGKTLRMDIQSLLNLWQLFGPDQFLDWTYQSIVQYQDDLFCGKLTDWLDDFDDIDVEMYDKEQWLLRKAIWQKVDYTRYPGLIRLAWSMFRNSIQRIKEKNSGAPDFRIPVPSGKRGYIRVDLRDHDTDGNFSARIKSKEVCLDAHGNLWIHPDDAEEFLSILGGGDMDDSASVIPLENNKAVLYRNPNQYGECVIRDIIFDCIEIKTEHKVIGAMPVKKLTQPQPKKNIECSSGNKLLDRFLTAQNHIQEYYEPYTVTNLLKTLTKISLNSASIGIASNAEMVRSVVGIKSHAAFNKLCRQFNWNLERIIDATVKDGVDCKDDMNAVRGLINYIVENKIEMPQSILHRFSESIRPNVAIAKTHALDDLLAAIKYLVDAADVEVLGKGCVSKGNRIAGRIDRVEVPVIEIGRRNIDNPLNDYALSILKDYNKRMAMLLDTTEEDSKKEAIQKIQRGLLAELSKYSTPERLLIVNAWAYKIYCGAKAVHDSILWISAIENLRGTADNMLSLLADTGLAFQIKKNGSVQRYFQQQHPTVKSRMIRLWSKQIIDVSRLIDVKELLVENKSVLIDGETFTLGDECSIGNGVYKIIGLSNSISRTSRAALKNSLSVCLV